MPEATFLVKINVPDISQIVGTASDIEEDLIAKGHDVISAVPWARDETKPQFGAGFAFAPPTIGIPPVG